ncbi:MAG: cupin-like domain-containing protein, partial [Sphaerospermopsis sp. SIO1G2]|nr:cupin-like domain-containing protein [Sphaerospermopsis sp. SIO1G2]
MNINLDKNTVETSVNTIKRIQNPTLEEFQAATNSFSQPVIITGKMAEWKAFKHWSIDYLSDAIGDKELDINISNKNKVFTFDTETGETLSSKKMKFSQFANSLNL